MLQVAHQVLLLPKKPYFVGIELFTNAGTPLTLTRPQRDFGIVNIAGVFRHAGGVAAPGTPAGMTSINSATAAVAYRTAWEVVNTSAGSGATTSSSAASATSMSGFMLSFKHAQASTPTAGATTTGTSTTPDPGSTNFTGLGAWNLKFAFCAWNGSATVTEWPGKALQGWQISEGTNGGCAVALIGHDASVTDNLTAFTISASRAWRAGTLGARVVGAV